MAQPKALIFVPIPLLLIFCLLSPALSHRCNRNRVIIVNPPTLADPLPFSYSHIAIDTRTRVADIAGQIPFNLSAQIVGDTLAEQLVTTERNIRLAMQAVGALIEDILSINGYIKNFKPQTDLTLFQQLGANLGSPVSTVVGVQALALDELLVEIELKVVVGRKKVRELQCKEN